MTNPSKMPDSNPTNMEVKLDELGAEVLSLLTENGRLKEALEIARPAFENLRDNQEQLDFDGSRVGVSRQALDETLAAIDTALSLREAK